MIICPRAMVNCLWSACASQFPISHLSRHKMNQYINKYNHACIENTIWFPQCCVLPWSQMITSIIQFTNNGFAHDCTNAPNCLWSYFDRSLNINAQTLELTTLLASFSYTRPMLQDLLVERTINSNDFVASDSILHRNLEKMICEQWTCIWHRFWKAYRPSGNHAAQSAFTTPFWRALLLRMFFRDKSTPWVGAWSCTGSV